MGNVNIKVYSDFFAFSLYVEPYMRKILTFEIKVQVNDKFLSLSDVHLFEKQMMFLFKLLKYLVI